MKAFIATHGFRENIDLLLLRAGHSDSSVSMSTFYGYLKLLQSFLNLRCSKGIQQGARLGNNNTNRAFSSTFRRPTGLFTNDQSNTSALPDAPPTAATNVQHNNHNNQAKCFTVTHNQDLHLMLRTILVMCKASCASLNKMLHPMMFPTTMIRSVDNCIWTL